MSYKDDLRQVISHNPAARGLALIIANQRGPQPGQPVLMGVTQDFARMTDTFMKLKFAVLSYMDISKVGLLAVVSEVATCQHYPQCYRRIAFVFSGHGRYHFISSHDGDVDINDIIARFQPCVTPCLGNLPKLFFIDACRGHVPMSPVFAPRGGEDVSTKIVPPYGNCLVAYSTMYLFKAFECEEGGVWMKLLSEKLRTLRKSVFDVLVDVNSELSEMYQVKAHWKILQQPTWEGSLNEHVKLLEEAERDGSELPPLFGCEEQPANPVELKRLVSLPPILTPSQDALHAPEGSHSLEERPPSLTVHNCWGSHKSYSADYEGTVEKTALKSQHPVMVKQLSEPTGGVASGDGSLEYALSAQTVHGTVTSTAHVATIGPNSQQQSVATHYPAELQVGATRQYQPLIVNQHVGGPLATPAAHSQYFPTSTGSVTTTGGAYHASSAQFPVLQRSLSHGQPAISKPLGCCREALNHYKQIGVILNYDFEDAELYDNMKMQMCYSSQVTVVLPNSSRAIIGSSCVTFPQKQLAREEAAKSAVQQLESLLPKPIPLQPQRDVSTAAPTHSESSMSEDARTQLNLFCQSNGVKPQFSFIEDASSGQTRYKCTINYTINGRPERIDSAGYFASKAAAKEEAARRLISEETSRMVSSRGATPTAKIWKSELKEYYDKTGRPGAPLKYTTKECPKNGYQCTLCAPDIGYVHGDICRSKSEAEHNAAYKALQQLKSR